MAAYRLNLYEPSTLFPTRSTKYVFVINLLSINPSGWQWSDTEEGVRYVWDMYWIGLHLFYGDTRPSGHISRPSQVGFSHSYLCSINKVLWWCSAVGINSTWKCRQLVIDLNKELYWVYGLSYQIKESSFSQKLYYASLGDRLKEGPQQVNCVVLITTLLHHCTFHEYVFNGQSLATMLACSRWSSGQHMGFCGLGMANSEPGYHNILSSGQVPKSLGWSKCWFLEIPISSMYRCIPLNLDLPLNVRVYQWLQIC